MKAVLLSATVLSLISATSPETGRLRASEEFRHKKDPEKLKALYEKYPQLTDPNVNACARGFGKMLMDLTYAPYDQMSMYSTFMINDLGNYRACQKIDAAGFMVASINISHSPISLNQGACFPKECTMAEYTHFTNEISNAITGFL